LKTDLVTKLCAAAFVGDLVGLKALLLLDGDHDIDECARLPSHLTEMKYSRRNAENLENFNVYVY
jgi:hypothetical protein